MLPAHNLLRRRDGFFSPSLWSQGHTDGLYQIQCTFVTGCGAGTLLTAHLQFSGCQNSSVSQGQNTYIVSTVSWCGQQKEQRVLGKAVPLPQTALQIWGGGVDRTSVSSKSLEGKLTPQQWLLAISLPWNAVPFAQHYPKAAVSCCALTAMPSAGEVGRNGGDIVGPQSQHLPLEPIPHLHYWETMYDMYVSAQNCCSSLSRLYLISFNTSQFLINSLHLWANSAYYLNILKICLY